MEMMLLVLLLGVGVGLASTAADLHLLPAAAAQLLASILAASLRCLTLPATLTLTLHAPWCELSND